MVSSFASAGVTASSSFPSVVKRLQADICQIIPHIAVEVAGDFDVHAAGARFDISGPVFLVLGVGVHPLGVRRVVFAHIRQVDPALAAVDADEALMVVDCCLHAEVIQRCIHLAGDRVCPAERVLHGDDNRIVLAFLQVDRLVQIDGVVTRILLRARLRLFISLVAAGGVVIVGIRIHLDEYSAFASVV